MFGLLKNLRHFSIGPPVSIYRNLYASKPAVRNRPKTENFKSYEDLGRMKQTVFREHSDEKGLGPIPSVDETAKLGLYKNPEYYSYHHYTYYDFEVGIQCVHLPQPSAIEEKDLVAMVRKSCCDDLEDQSGRCCAPPSCSIECMKAKAAQGCDEKDESSLVLEEDAVERQNPAAEHSELMVIDKATVEQHSKCDEPETKSDSSIKESDQDKTQNQK